MSATVSRPVAGGRWPAGDPAARRPPTRWSARSAGRVIRWFLLPHKRIVNVYVHRFTSKAWVVLFSVAGRRRCGAGLPR
jgi:hypothetical protein